MGTVFNIQKFCIHDGDGIRTCVFLKGCPLNCVWCHNPEGLKPSQSLSIDLSRCTLCGNCLNGCSARKIESNKLLLEREKCVLCRNCVNLCHNSVNEIIGKEMTATEVFEDVLKDKIFYETSGGGLTISGGEPSYQPDFTLEILSLAVSNGIHVAVETCGTGTREFYEKASDLGATFLYDIKCIDRELHRKLTGADNNHITENLKYLMTRGADVIIRLPIIPECNDSEESIVLLSGFLKENEGRYRYAEIMPYHTLGTDKARKLGINSSYTHTNASKEDISRWKTIFNNCGVDVKISE